MKKCFELFISVVCVLLLTSPVFAGSTGIDYIHMQEQASAPDTPPSGECAIYVNSDGTALIIKNDAAASVTLSAGTGDNTLDAAYDESTAGAGRAVTVDTGAIALSNTDADANALLTINHSPSSSAASEGLVITMGGNASGAAFELENSGTGYDIEGTAGWYVTKAGALTVASVTCSGAFSTGSFTPTSITVSSTAEVGGNLTIDDGTTDTPYLIFRDGSDENASLYKADGSHLIVTLGSATDALNVLTGCLKVGDGSPDDTLNAEDAYVEGTFEVDGTAQFDGTITAAAADFSGAVTMASTLALSENVTFTMAADEYLKLDAASTDMTQANGALDIDIDSVTTAASGLNVKLTVPTGGGAGAEISAIFVDIDDDSNAAGEIIGIVVDSTDSSGSSATKGIAFQDSAGAATGVETCIHAEPPAAGQYLVLDASTVTNTGTSGLIDIDFDSKTTASSAINLKTTLVTGGASGEEITGIYIDVDDDSNAAGEVSAITIDSTDASGSSDTWGIAFQANDGSATGVEQCIHAEPPAAGQYLVLDAATVDSTTTSGVIDIDYDTLTTAASALHLTTTLLASAGAGVEVTGMYLDVQDDSDSASTVTGITLDSTDATGSSEVRGIAFETIAGADTLLDTCIYAETDADTQVLVIEAAGTDHTGTEGVIDIAYDSAAAAASAINVKVEHVAGGTGQKVAGIEVELLSDADNASDETYGLLVNATDTTDSGTLTGVQIEGAGLDLGIGVDTGGIRIGTGSAAGQTLGDDTLFVEGLAEIDGVTYTDGGLTCAGAASFTSTTAFTGATNLFTLGAAEYVKIDSDSTAHTGTTGALDINFGSKTNGAAALNIYTNYLTAGTASQYVSGILIDVDDDSNQATTISGIRMDSSDASGSGSVVGLAFESGAGADTAIEKCIVAQLPAAGTFINLDADGTLNTATGGVIDIDYQSITTAASAIDLVVTLGDNTGNEEVAGIFIDVQDDSDAAATVSGITIDSTDSTGSSVIRGISFEDEAGADTALDMCVKAQLPAIGQYLVLDADGTLNTSAAGVIDIDYQTVTTAASAIDLVVTIGDNTGNEEVAGIFIDVQDDSDAAATVSGMTIDSTDVTGSSVVRGISFEAEDGTDTGVEVCVKAQTPAAGQYLVLDADGTLNTATAGVIDIDYQSATTACAAINLVATIGDNTGSEEVMGIYIDAQDDSDAAATVSGLWIDSTDYTGSSAVRGITFATIADADTGLEQCINAQIPAAGQYLVLDAANTVQTQTSGAIDIDWQSATTGASAINLVADIGDNTGTGQEVMGIFIDAQDSSDEAAFITAITIDSTVTGGASAIRGIAFEDAAGADTGVETCIQAQLPAAGKYLNLDATGTANTGTAGVIDIDYRTATASGVGILLDVENDCTGASEKAYGLFIQMDDDAANANNETHGISIDTDGNGTGLQYAIYVGATAGIDAAFKSVGGYVTISDGAYTPSTTQTIGSVAIESTLEVDGAINMDGALTGEGTTSTTIVGVNRVVEAYTGADNVITIAEAGTIFTNTGDGDGSMHTLPEASTCKGASFTFVVDAAQNLNINPKDGVDTILHHTCAAGDSIQSGTQGDSITLTAITDDLWAVTAIGAGAGDYTDTVWTDAN